ncbi:MAG: hypothetical protein ACXVQR_07055 [Solirubrobacteraceae bacterium]
MAVKLYKPGSDYAKRLIREGKAVRDDRGAWSEHQPSAAQENEYTEAHGLVAYGRWHLAVDDQLGPRAKGRYKSRSETSSTCTAAPCWPPSHASGQPKYTDVELAAAHLHGLLGG